MNFLNHEIWWNVPIDPSYTLLLFQMNDNEDSDTDRDEQIFKLTDALPLFHFLSAKKEKNSS